MRRWLGRVGVALLVAAAPVGVYLAPGTGPAYPKAWDPRVAGLVGFVEQERGLRFEHPVAVEFLSDKDFRAKVTSSPEERAQEKEDLERYLGELRALGLVSGNPDLRAAQDELVGSSIVGLYVNETKTLYVRGTSTTPYVRGVIVHELTHALQDQHFDLGRLQDEAPAGAENATSALIEGDAVRVQNAWVRTLGGAEQSEYAQGEQAAGKTADEAHDVPPVLQDLLSFPYVFGPTYLDSLVVRGNSEVDKAFRKPPVSEAQVVAPAEHGLDFRPTKVPDPRVPEGGKRVDDPAAFGQFSLFEVLGPQLGQQRAWDAVSGWAGDRYVSYRADGRTCLAVDVASTDVAHAEALEGALQEWRRGLPRTTLSRKDATVSLTTCDPGSELQRPEVKPRAFDVMAARAQAVDYLVQQAHIGFRAASCIADRVLRSVGPELFVSPASSAAEQQRGAQAFQDAYSSC